MDCEKELADILAAWETLINKTNDPEATEETIEEAYQTFDEVVMGVAVKHGHPGKPYPRRKP